MLRARARSLDDRLHRLRPGRARRLPRDDRRTSGRSSATGSSGADDKNAALLPRRVDGKWILFHRPKTESGGSHGEILLSRSADLPAGAHPSRCFSRARRLVGFASYRDRSAAAPDGAWLARRLPRREGDRRRRHLPGRPRARWTSTSRPVSCAASQQWILGPIARTSVTGDVPNVVFPCGLVHDAASGDVRLYYGAADTSVVPGDGATRRPAGSSARRPSLRDPRSRARPGQTSSERDCLAAARFSLRRSLSVFCAASCRSSSVSPLPS